MTSSKFITKFKINRQWKFDTEQNIKTIVYDTKDFEALRCGILITKNNGYTQEKEYHFKGDLYKILPNQIWVFLRSRPQYRFSYTTNRKIYKHRSGLLLYHDFVIFEDGDPFIVTEIIGDASQLHNHIGKNSRMTIIEGLFRYYPDIYDEYYKREIIPNGDYECDWDTWDNLPPHSNKKEHNLILRFQGRLFTKKD
jgi:hypothetical protein